MNGTLSKQQENFCENAGIFGLLISIGCLIQHIIFMIPSWVTLSIIPVYCLCIASFILLMRKKAIAPRLLMISGILVLLVELLMTFSLAFSLILLLLLIYLVIIIAVSMGGDLSKKLKLKALEEKAEEDKWKGVI